MFLSITITRNGANDPPATDLGYLLHKNPERLHEVELSFGKAFAFYPQATAERCEVAVVLDVDPIGLVRGGSDLALDQYVNDRPYVASSFLCVALNRLFSTTMNGRSKLRQELVEHVLQVTATVAVVRSRGGEALLRRLFEPLGYRVATTRAALDESRPDWGDSPYFTLQLEADTTVAALLRHLYVLLPVLDDGKHYWVGEAEIDKLLARGATWLADHPERELIAHRYLRHQHRLTRAALSRLVGDEADPDAAQRNFDAEEQQVEGPLSLNAQRLGAVLAVIEQSGATSVLDLGCGEGKLLRELLTVPRLTRIVGMDVAVQALETAAKRLRLDRLPERQRRRLELIQGSLMYRDARLAGFEAAACVEVIEHLDPPRLGAFERVVFELARPATVVVTTPNREYNVLWESLPAGRFRHRDHRFEWSRAEFGDWAEAVASKHGYRFRALPIGPVHPELGPPTQMGVFEL